MATTWLTMMGCPMERMVVREVVMSWELGSQLLVIAEVHGHCHLGVGVDLLLFDLDWGSERIAR
jgi:hypothetical protein